MESSGDDSVLFESLDMEIRVSCRRCSLTTTSSAQYLLLKKISVNDKISKLEKAHDLDILDHRDSRIPKTICGKSDMRRSDPRQTTTDLDNVFLVLGLRHYLQEFVQPHGMGKRSLDVE